MIKQIRDNKYRFQIKDTVYYVGVFMDSWFNSYRIKCYNRASIWSFYDRVTPEGPGEAGNKYLNSNTFLQYNQPYFATKEEGIRFLYFLDKFYNPTPEPKMQIINLKFVI